MKHADFFRNPPRALDAALTFEPEAAAAMDVGIAASDAFSARASFGPLAESLNRLCRSTGVGLVRLNQGLIAPFAAAGNTAFLHRTSARDLMLCGPRDPGAHGGKGFDHIFWLGQGRQGTDLFLCSGAPFAGQQVLDPILSRLRELWKGRAAGVVEAALCKGEDRAREVHPLSDENPFGMTRAERAVAELVAKGLRATDIANRLDCALPTVRTHLRSLYGKTGSAGLVELIHLLQPGQQWRPV